MWYMINNLPCFHNLNESSELWNYLEQCGAMYTPGNARKWTSTNISSPLPITWINKLSMSMQELYICSSAEHEYTGVQIDFNFP